MISAVVVNYKSSSPLYNSVKNIVNFVDEVIVVNHSPEEDLTFIQSLSPKIRIYTRQNYGYGAGCNFGAKKAKGDILIFFNPDTMILEETIPLLIKELKDDISVVAPLLLYPDGTPQPSTRKFPTLKHLFVSRTSPFWFLFSKSDTALDYFGGSQPESTKPTTLTDRFPLGGFFLIKRDHFQELGGFDERFFLFFEDTDFLNRLINAGYKVCLNQEARVIHLIGYSRKANPFKSEYHKMKSFYLYYSKHTQCKLLRLVTLMITLLYIQILSFSYFIDNPVKEREWKTK